MDYAIDRIKEYRHHFQGKRIGLITNAAALDSSFRMTVDLLSEICQVTALFAPEHGIYGNIADGKTVEEGIDARTGARIYSLYHQKEEKRLTRDRMEEVDVFVYDIQDTGLRFYTFISTLFRTMEDLSGSGKKLVILDRPDPLGGNIVEGNMAVPGYFSFVGMYSICSRYGLTAGELAELYGEETGLNCELSILPCRDLKREAMFPELDKHWIPPSPGLPTFETALIYAGTCMLEGTNVSEGRGTACPFKMIGAPFVKAEQLAKEMNRRKLPGAAFIPAYFTPAFSKHKEKQCNGIQIFVTDLHGFRPVRMGAELLDAFRNLYPEDFCFLPPPKGSTQPFISKLAGDAFYEAPDWNLLQVLERMGTDCEIFEKRKKQYHIY